MNYTIVSMRTYGGEQELWLDQIGNKYGLVLIQNEPRIYRNGTYDTIEEAYEHFEKISKCMVLGTHSFEDRAKML